MFELYGTGEYAEGLRKAIASQFGFPFSKGYLEHTLKNPFYAGLFSGSARHIRTIFRR